MKDATEGPMAFFRSASITVPMPELYRGRIILRAPQMGDFEQWATLRDASRDFLEPWEPTWPSDDLTRAAFRRRLRRYADDVRADAAYPFFMFDRNNRLLGGLTLTHIRRGVAQAASLGYWIGAPYAHQGFMTLGVLAVIDFTFKDLRLHRLEAACIPTNKPSIGLLEKTGFEHEGYAREYLCINGIWQDHLLFARLEKPAGPGPGRQQAAK